MTDTEQHRAAVRALDFVRRAKDELLPTVFVHGNKDACIQARHAAFVLSEAVWCLQWLVEQHGQNIKGEA